MSEPKKAAAPPGGTEVAAQGHGVGAKEERFQASSRAVIFTDYGRG